MRTSSYLCIIFACLLTVKSQAAPSQRPVGTTFSIPYAKWLSGEWGGKIVGDKWPIALEKICRQGFSEIRLPIQWDQVEPAQNRFDLTEIEQAIRICARFKIPVILTLGLSNPRNPRINIPGFYESGNYGLFSNDMSVGTAARLKILQRHILNRYGNDPRVKAFQVEDCPLDPTAIDQNDLFRLLKAEITHIRVRTKKPLYITMNGGLSDQDGVDTSRKARLAIARRLLTLPVDKIGIDIWVNRSDSGKLVTIQQPRIDTVREILRLCKEKGVGTFASQIQGEPKETDAKKLNFQTASQSKSFGIAGFRASLQIADQLGLDQRWIWGVEFQQACAKQGDRIWLAEVHKALNK